MRHDNYLNVVNGFIYHCKTPNTKPQLQAEDEAAHASACMCMCNVLLSSMRAKINAPFPFLMVLGYLEKLPTPVDINSSNH